MRRNFLTSVAIFPAAAVSLAIVASLLFGSGAPHAQTPDPAQDAEKYIKEAVSHLDGMTERERYRTRGLYYMITGDSQQCVKEFGDLVARYTADASARNNLALCLTYLRDMPRALDEMRQVVKILPNRALYRENLALYAAYSGNCGTAEDEARAIENPSQFALLARAFAQLGQGSSGRGDRHLPHNWENGRTRGVLAGVGLG